LINQKHDGEEMGHLDVETAWKELSDWDTEVNMKNLLPVWVAVVARADWRA
jgi:hypothetical protein